MMQTTSNTTVARAAALVIDEMMRDIEQHARQAASFDYLDNPYSLAERRGTVYGQKVA